MFVEVLDNCIKALVSASVLQALTTMQLVLAHNFSRVLCFIHGTDYQLSIKLLIRIFSQVVMSIPFLI